MSGGEIDFRTFFLALCEDIANDPEYKNRFRRPHREFHTFFWKLSQDPKTQFLVAGLFFNTNGTYPHSEQIDALLQELCLSVLDMELPSGGNGQRYAIKISRGYNIEDKLDPDQISTYQQVVEKFKQQFCTPV